MAGRGVQAEGFLRYKKTSITVGSPKPLYMAWKGKHKPTSSGKARVALLAVKRRRKNKVINKVKSQGWWKVAPQDIHTR